MVRASAARSSALPYARPRSDDLELLRPRPGADGGLSTSRQPWSRLNFLARRRDRQQAPRVRFVSSTLEGLPTGPGGRAGTDAAHHSQYGPFRRYYLTPRDGERFAGRTFVLLVTAPHQP